MLCQAIANPDGESPYAGVGTDGVGRDFDDFQSKITPLDQLQLLSLSGGRFCCTASVLSEVCSVPSHPILILFLPEPA